MPTPGQSRATSILIWLAGIVLIVAVVFWVHGLSHREVEVRVARVTYQSIAKTVSTNGKVEPIEEFQAHAAFSGVIKKIFVDVGQHVSPGQLLVKMDDSPAISRLATAQSQLTTAELALQDMQRGGSLEERTRFGSEISSARLERQEAAAKLATAQKLQQTGAASAGEVDLAQQRLRAADLALQTAQQRTEVRYAPGDISGAQARVADARANLAAARVAFADVDIHAPQAGTVYSIPVSEYDFVPAGDDILDVADLTHLRIRAYFDEPDIGGLAAGQAVDVVWEAKPGVVWHGHVQSAPITVITYEKIRNVGECIITVDDTKGVLLPNTNVTVTVTEVRHNHVLSIPREGLHTEGANQFVYTIADGKLARRAVQIGVVNQTSAEIVSGLSVNDMIVLGPRSTTVDLSTGLKVTPVL